ncbi:hypothetical protein LY474_40470 [Myxococcus stipitatus]|uniref:hypothetical protein n=1 Tax=Myxococcus stipitatus TaxID=83455 RepID=UPI001F1D4736|nr:hypothetical protein [Myxococcus stipitatus]MCE9674083.1 hypothetical protein [Myxococcus stipitatus]
MPQESTLLTTVPFRKGKQVLEREAGYTPGQMMAPPGTVCDAIVMDFECQVSASAAVATALTMTQRLAVLSLFTFNLKLSLAGEQTMEPWQGTTLDRMRLASLRILELDAEGLDDATGGLARTYAAGNNTVSFRVYAPTGHVAKIRESALFTGLSPEQLLDADMSVTRGDADPFRGANASLTLSTVKVTFSPGLKKAEARRLGLPVHERKLTNAESDTVSTPDGLVLDLSQEGALLGTTLGIVRVTVGGITVADDPATPARIYADYLRRYPGVSQGEKDITTSRTPLYLVSPGPLTRQFAGSVAVKQKERTTEWAARVLYLPLPSHEVVMGMVQAYAARLEPGRSVIAVSTAMYEGMQVDDALLPYCGMTLFRDDEEGYGDYPGLYCSAGGTPYVYVPEQRQRQAALKVADAMRKTPMYPAGNKRLVKSVVLDEVRWVPGAITAPGGFAVMSRVRQDVTTVIREAVTSYNAALSGAL